MIQLRTLLETLLDEILYLSILKKYETVFSAANLDEIELSLPLAIQSPDNNCKHPSWLEEMVDIVILEVSKAIRVESLIAKVENKIKGAVISELCKFRKGTHR